MAGRAEKSGQLNISPELLRELMNNVRIVSHIFKQGLSQWVPHIP